MFKKILIANRGEITVRIIRACHEMGVKTVAVYSEADRESLHVKLADEAFCIGPPPPNLSYLNIPSIISVAELSGAEAIHPGYGFLAENAKFAHVCEAHNIKFIGPTVQSIETMGDKIAARESVMKEKVPVVPGSDGAVEDEQEILKLGDEIGFPILVKAAAGGGGKGMRVAKSKEEFLGAVKTAQSEARAAFGNPAVYLEKYIELSRHIEFQILADNYGNIIHLGDRDCTVQRRHQKLIEESPSPIMTDELRQKMGDAAVGAARAANYQGAGTIEFLVDSEKNFYFIEMNTRIQVEHPVTEMVTGVDLIKEQLRIAAGEKLELKQEDVSFSGHAIECRINAENPDKGFLPCPGEIKLYVPPGGPGVRVVCHAYSGYRVSPTYDSLVAKLIVHAKDREQAILKMRRALEEFIITGIETTVSFHEKTMAHPVFQKGEFYTNFIQECFK